MKVYVINLILDVLILKNDYQINIHSSSYRHSQSMNEILKFQLENPDKYLILDSDMFLIDILILINIIISQLLLFYNKD